MGQYFILRNISKGQNRSVGTFYAEHEEWELYVKKFNWSMEDTIIAQGDHGDIYRLNDPNSVPEEYSDVFSYSDWSIILFASKKLDIKPEEFAELYLTL